MNSEDADAAVWITVGPCMSDGGIIDRKELEHLLTGRSHKINHSLQVTEITDTGTLTGTQ